MRQRKPALRSWIRRRQNQESMTRWSSRSLAKESRALARTHQRAVETRREEHSRLATLLVKPQEVPVQGLDSLLAGDFAPVAERSAVTAARLNHSMLLAFC